MYHLFTEVVLGKVKVLLEKTAPLINSVLTTVALERI